MTRRIAAFSPFMSIRDNQLHAAQAAPQQALEERSPKRFRFGWANVQADDLAFAVGVCGHGDYCRNRNHAPALALLEAGRVQPKIGPIANKRTIQEGADTAVDALAPLAHRALADPSQPHRLRQVVHPPGRHAVDPGFLDHGDQRLLRRLARLQERREVAALPQLGDAQLQAAQPRVQVRSR